MASDDSLRELYERQWLAELMSQGHKYDDITAGYPAWALTKKSWGFKRLTVHQVLNKLADAQRKARKAGTLRWVGEEVEEPA